jgi:RNA polymerase sigma-70 factor (ECF subfamily)
MSYGQMDKQQKIFSQIYDQYIDKIYRFIFLKVNSQEKAQDLCSETFLRGWRTFKEKKGQIENCQAFLYRIARNLVIDHYREKARTQIVSADNVPVIDPKEDLENKSLLNSDLERVKSALDNLQDNYQEIIIWHYVEDLSIPEIAKILNKSEGAVRVTLHRALNAIRNEIKEG